MEYSPGDNLLAKRYFYARMVEFCYFKHYKPFDLNIISNKIKSILTTRIRTMY